MSVSRVLSGFIVLGMFPYVAPNRSLFVSISVLASQNLLLLPHFEQPDQIVLVFPDDRSIRFIDKFCDPKQAIQYSR